MKRDQLSEARNRAWTGHSWQTALRIEGLEERRLLTADAQWIPLTDLASDVASVDVPVADPAVLVGSGSANTDAASLLAAGGPGDPSLPGFANVARSADNGTVVYLGGGWAITASHVSLTSSINFGGTYYTVDTSSVHQLHNADSSLTDLKMFRVLGDPPLPELLSSYIATSAPSGHVFMIGNGLTRVDQKFWSVNKTQSPWVWTEISEPIIATSNNYGGVTYSTPRTIRWGENAVKDTNVSITVGGLTITGFTTQFDSLKFTGQTPYTYEAQASSGDSGGAVFSYVGGKWVLSGLMIAVSGALSGQPSNTALYGNITLMIDLSVYRNEILSTIGAVDHYVFYNDSAFDGNNAAANANDDAAIATDKVAYTTDAGLATSVNVTNYTKGINGIMIDVARISTPITASDFTFKVGNNNAPSTWADAPAPATVTVRSGAGVSGSDRIEITWANGAIVNTWLQVTFEGNDAAGGFNTNTGLASSDIFYWGNKVADSGSNPGATTFNTTTTDSIQVFSDLGSATPITDVRDYNRDGLVNTTDSLVVFSSLGSIVRLDLSSTSAAPEAIPTSATAPTFASTSTMPLLAVNREVEPGETRRWEVPRTSLNDLHRWIAALEGLPSTDGAEDGAFSSIAEMLVDDLHELTSVIAKHRMQRG